MARLFYSASSTMFLNFYWRPNSLELCTDWAQVQTVSRYWQLLIKVLFIESELTISVKCYFAKIILRLLSRFGLWKMWATSLSLVPRTVPSDFGIVTIIRLLLVVSLLLSRKDLTSVECNLSAQFSQTKSFWVVGQMDASEPTVLTIVNYFGKSTMLTKAAWLLFV